MTLSAEAREALNELLEEGFAPSAIEFLKELAAAIFKEQNGNPVVQYTPRSDKETWKYKFFGPKPDAALLRESSPLSRTGTQHRFMHRSLLEYFYSRHIHEATAVETLTAENEQNLLIHPFGQTNIVKESSIVDFLAEHVQSDPTFKKKLLQILELSKTDASARQAAANAITILVRAGVTFNGADLRGIKIPGADLSGGQFDSAQLQGADLRDTNLRNIWLRQTDLSDAQMEDARFGEYPYLDEEHAVHSCAYSPDGKILAAGLVNGTINLYDAATWERTCVLSGHTGTVGSVVFSPSGQQIASGSEDRTVRLWDALSGAPSAILSGHTSYVYSVVFSPSGQQIASGSDDKTVRLWDAQTGAPCAILSGHTVYVTSVVFPPSGLQIASGSEDRTVRLWDTQTGAPGAILSGHTDWVNSVVFSPSGLQIASGSSDKTVRLWDAQTGAPGAILSGHTDDVTSVVFSPSGQQIASGSEDKTVRLWDAQTGAPGAILSGHTDWVNSVVFSPSGQQIASGSDDKTVWLWDVETGYCLAIMSDFHGGIMSIAWNANENGSYLATGCLDKSVCVWKVEGICQSMSVHLVWSSGHEQLVVSDAKMLNAQGLSSLNRKLLEQRGATSKPAAFQPSFPHMPMSLQSPLESVDLLLSIAALLDKNSVLACSRVCRSWRVLFEPFLWHQVTLFRYTSNSPYPSPPSLQIRQDGLFSPRQPYWRQQSQAPPQRRQYPTLTRIQTNAHHIRQLRYLGGERPFLQQLLPVCTQLRHLEVTVYSDDVKQLLLQNTATLETFICRSDPLTRQTQDPVVLDRIYYLLAEMPNLRVLELDSVIVSDYEGKTFGRVCQSLARLSLINSKLIERPKHSSPEAEAQGFANLRSLILDRSYLPNDHQLQTFQSCPALEHLTWKSRTGTLPIMHFLGFLSSGQFHSVTSLDLSNATASDGEFASVLKHLPQLTHLNVKKSLFGREATNILLLEDPGPRQRLQRLNTLDCPNFTSVEAQDVLENCERLQVFYAPAVSAVEMARNRWKCLDLQELDICITELDQLLPRTSFRHQEIYRQLGALSNLRVLRLGDPGRPSFSPPTSSNPQRRPDPNEDVDMTACPPPSASSSILDLRLHNGLGALSTLTQLQELDCEKLQARMEFIELQWVVLTWRRLKLVVGKVHPNLAQRDLSNEFLRDMVPGLRVYQSRMEIWMAELS
ncbi:unnamed protein product [Mortierella alpina]